MTKALLCPCPVLLDQNFPRSDQELEEIAIAIGTLHAGLQGEDFGLILPESFSLFLETFDWNRTVATPLLRDIYRILEYWLLRENSHVLRPVFPSMQIIPHPIPCGTPISAEVDLWAEEVQRLLTAHDQVINQAEFFIGIASSRAFAGGAGETYCPEPQGRHLPLIGPLQIDDLSSYWTARIPANLHQRKVTVSEAKSHVHLLGGILERRRGGTSHLRVDFGRGRGTWTLGTNDDPQEDSRIAQLVPLCGKPFDVVKYVLIHGREPEVVGRFDGMFSC